MRDNLSRNEGHDWKSSLTISAAAILTYGRGRWSGRAVDVPSDGMTIRPGCLAVHRGFVIAGRMGDAAEVSAWCLRRAEFHQDDSPGGRQRSTPQSHNGSRTTPALVSCITQHPALPLPALTEPASGSRERSTDRARLHGMTPNCDVERCRKPPSACNLRRGVCRLCPGGGSNRHKRGATWIAAFC